MTIFPIWTGFRSSSYTQCHAVDDGVEGIVMVQSFGLIVQLEDGERCDICMWCPCAYDKMNVTIFEHPWIWTGNDANARERGPQQMPRTGHHRTVSLSDRYGDA